MPFALPILPRDLSNSTSMRSVSPGTTGLRHFTLSADMKYASLPIQLQHAGHDGVIGEVALEMRFVHRHIFDAGDLVALDAGDAIDHQERIAMRENLHQLVCIQAAAAGQHRFNLRG